MLSAEKINRRYFHEAYRTGQHGWETEEPSPFAVACMKRLPKGTMLDIGCGEGRHAIAAANLGFKVTAIDFEPQAIQRAKRFARKHGAKGIVFQQADALRLPFMESNFDLVLDYGCLHHQRKASWPCYKASLLRVLKRDGFYVLSVFSPRFRLFAGSRPWHIAEGSYRRFFRRADILGLFGRDFEIVEMVEDEGGFWHILMKRKASRVE